MTALAAILKWCLEYWYVIVIGAAIAFLASWGATMREKRDAARVDQVKAEKALSDFKAETDAAQAKQAKEALAKAVADEKLKEEADAKNERDKSALRADADRLRRERDAARASIVPTAPAGSKCPDGQACFDTALLERALRDYRSEIRAGFDECTSVTADLDTAKRWAGQRE